MDGNLEKNKPEVVMIPTAEYERMKSISDSIEYHAIADIIDERMEKLGKQ
jgi:PHD/YefM family antitoxin component YafN of YafNO toxin-antitoxin module